MFNTLLKSSDTNISYIDKNVLVCFSGSSSEDYFHIEHLSNVNECDIHFGGVIDIYILNNKVVHLRNDNRIALLLKAGKIHEISSEFNDEFFYPAFLKNKELFNYLSADCVYYDLYCSLYYN